MGLIQRLLGFIKRLLGMTSFNQEMLLLSTKLNIHNTEVCKFKKRWVKKVMVLTPPLENDRIFSIFLDTRPFLRTF